LVVTEREITKKRLIGIDKINIDISSRSTNFRCTQKIIPARVYVSGVGKLREIFLFRRYHIQTWK
jgi:hypothetical protein